MFGSLHWSFYEVITESGTESTIFVRFDDFASFEGFAACLGNTLNMKKEMRNFPMHI